MHRLPQFIYRYWNQKMSLASVSIKDLADSPRAVKTSKLIHMLFIIHDFQPRCCRVYSDHAMPTRCAEASARGWRRKGYERIV